MNRCHGAWLLWRRFSTGAGASSVWRRLLTGAGARSLWRRLLTGAGATWALYRVSALSGLLTCAAGMSWAVWPRFSTGAVAGQPPTPTTTHPVSIDRASVEREQAVSELTIERVALSGKTFLLSVKRGKPPPVRSRVFVLQDGRPVVRGVVVLRRDGMIGATLDEAQPELPSIRPGQTAICIPADWAAHLRARLPAGSSISGRVTAANPDGIAQITVTAPGSILPGDQFLVEREGWPIARLNVERVESDAATARVARLVSNADVAAGDVAWLWPTPIERRTGRLQSRVLRVQPQAADHEIWIPAPLPDAASSFTDRWIIRRDGAYVGIADVEQLTDRFVVAAMPSALSIGQPRIGDDAVRRPAEDVAAGRLPLHVFRVEGTYCLITGGEADGLTQDSRLVVVRGGRAVARLSVSMLNPDHCGATFVEKLVDEADFAIRLWDEVYVGAKLQEREVCGQVAGAADRTGVVQVTWRPGVSVGVGRLVFARGAHRDRASVVISSSGAQGYIAPLDERAPPLAPGDVVMREALE